MGCLQHDDQAIHIFGHRRQIRLIRLIREALCKLRHRSDTVARAPGRQHVRFRSNASFFRYKEIFPQTL